MNPITAMLFEHLENKPKENWKSQQFLYLNLRFRATFEKNSAAYNLKAENLESVYIDKHWVTLVDRCYSVGSKKACFEALYPLYI